MSGIGRLKKYGVTKEQWIAERAAGRRWCSGKCKAFAQSEKFSAGSKGICKACESVISKRWRDALSFEERKEKWTKYRTPETLRAMRERAKRIRAALTVEERQADSFKNRLAYRFKTTTEWFAAQLEKQGGGCGVCGQPQGKEKRRLAIDHSHTCCSGRVTCGKCNRGLLCEKCNLYVGVLEDLMSKGDWIEKATAYLKQYE